MLATTQWPLERAVHLTSLVWVCVLWLPESLMDLSELCRSKKTSKIHVTGLCEGNPPVTGGFPSQRATKWQMFPFDDVIMKHICSLIQIVKWQTKLFRIEKRPLVFLWCDEDSKLEQSWHLKNRPPKDWMNECLLKSSSYKQLYRVKISDSSFNAGCKEQ